VKFALWGYQLTLKEAPRTHLPQDTEVVRLIIIRKAAQQTLQQTQEEMEAMKLENQTKQPTVQQNSVIQINGYGTAAPVKPLWKMHCKECKKDICEASEMYLCQVYFTRFLTTTHLRVPGFCRSIQTVFGQSWLEE
jgi:hypothetical protein